MTSPSPHGPSEVSASEAELAEDRFFGALLASDLEQLERLLTNDFLIIDVMSGATTDRASFIAAFNQRALLFDRIDVVERLSRRHGDTVIIVGRTQMAGSFNAAPFAAASRYTHVLVRERDGQWQLANAQGTPIVDAERL